MSDNSITRRLASEAIGTAFLLATVVGSGIMAERLAGGNVAIALLANTVATGAGLVALILTFGPVSGAHFNPAVTLADAAMGGLAWRDVLPYIAAQVLGAFAGVATAHVMFSEVIFSASHHVRSGPAQLVSELVATFGLLSVIWGVSRRHGHYTPFAVGAYITAAYWFTASTSFANPAVTIARTLTNRDGQPWIMRRRAQLEMDELVRRAGFEKVGMEIDRWGIFSVSVARRVAT